MYGINAIDIMVDVINGKNTHGIASGGKVKEFFKRFDNSSVNEWFETPKDIEDYFHNEKNFQRLIEREFDKLNIQFSVILLAEYKNDFNQIIQRTLSKTNRIPENILIFASEYCFKLFPGLADKVEKTNVELPTNIFELNDFSAKNFQASKERTNLELYESAERKDMYKLVDEAINNSAETTLSKVLNARSFGALALRDLQLTVKHEFGFSAPFRRAITSAEDIGI